MFSKRTKILSCFLLFSLMLSACTQRLENTQKDSDSVDEPLVAEESVFYFGEWIFLTAIPDNNPDGYTAFIYSLTFLKDGSIKYMTGWQNSEISASFEGTYSFTSDNTVSVEMHAIHMESDPENYPSIEAVLNLHPYSANMLGITLVSGTKLFYLQELNIPVWFTRANPM